MPVKRYRVLAFDWDSIGDTLNVEIQEEWDEEIKALHRKNRERDTEWLSKLYGELGFEAKLDNLRTIGGQAFSIGAFHNEFYRQAREAFIVGAYYPALTGASALGERILNELLLGLRENYRHTPEYKKVYRKEKFDDWDTMVETLESWEVLLPDAAKAFRALKEVRNKRAIHYNPATTERDREFAIEALKYLDQIISIQFGAFRFQPWFIPDVFGAAFIRKDWESNPFVKLVYIPASLPVGPYHWMEYNEGQWTIYDRNDYEDREISDAEYARLQAEFTKRPIQKLPNEGDTD
jgi:hypothetical protein